MPRRHVTKPDIEESYYHVYARGGSKQPIFLCHADYKFFIALFPRYLSPDVVSSSTGVAYPHLRDKVELLSFCLMNNHFHLQLYQAEEHSMAKLMRGIMTSYTRYFNCKYNRSGPIFESTYKASHISSQEYLLHISRYIHMNPRYWLRYPYSSLKYYLGDDNVCWLQNKRILELHPGKTEYREFLENYQESKDELEEVKRIIAT